MLIRVLLTASHSVMRRQLRCLLETEPRCEICSEAADSEEAMKLAEQLRPDVAILDHDVPGRDLEAARQIKAFVPRSRVLIISTHEVDGYATVLATFGLEEWLPKAAE